MRAGLLSAAARARFQREAQVLARLEHPGIGRIYDTGVHETELGPIPYFAMELIHEARAITEHASLHGLSIRDRVAMFAGICDAVHHGHQRGIIHRDLKPSNILVGRYGDEASSRAEGVAAPKVIDFGIARCTDADMTLVSLETGRDAMMGTLAYMSPEQCGMDPADIDTRSDVYALGVVLFELLTGRLPYDVAQKSLPEAVRIVQQEPAIRPTAIEPKLGQDLSVILLKCLSKERAARYDSAAELGADLRRWMEQLPIVARPASRMYQLRMFTRRHRPLVLAAAGIAVVVVAGLIATSVGLRSAVVERDRARAAETATRQEKVRAESIADFLQGVLRSTGAPVLVSDSTDPEISPVSTSIGRVGGPMTVDRPASLRDVIVATDQRLDAGAMTDPVLAAQLRLLIMQLRLAQIRNVQVDEKLLGAAPEEFARAADVLGRSSDGVLATGLILGGTLSGMGLHEEAHRVLLRLYDDARTNLGPGDLRTLEVGRAMCVVMYQRHLGDPVVVAERLVADAAAAHGERARATLKCRVNLAYSCEGLEGQARAAGIGREILDTLGPDARDDDELVQDALLLSILPESAALVDRATLERIADVQRRVRRGSDLRFGGDARITFDITTTLTNTLVRLGRFEEAARLTREVADDAAKRLGSDNHLTIKSRSRVARLMLWGGGDLDEALRLATQACEGEAANGSGPPDDYWVFHEATLLDLRRARGNPAAALEGIDTLIRNFLRDWKRVELPWFGGYLHTVAAQCLEQMGRLDDARARWLEAMSDIDKHLDPTAAQRAMTLRLGAKFFEAHGPPDVAREWRERASRVSPE